MSEGNASLRYILKEGSARFSAGDYSGAIAVWVPLLEALDASEVSGNPPLQEVRISTLVNSGAALRALGHISEAMNAYSMAIDDLGKYLDPERVDLIHLAAIAHLNLGNLFDQIGETESAVQAWKVAWSHFSTKSLEDKDEYDLTRVRMLSDLGSALRRMGDSNGAFAAFTNAEAAFEKLQRREASQASVISEGATLYINYGNALGEKGDIDGALMAYEKAKKLLNSTPTSLEADQYASLARIHTNLGVLWRERGNASLALDAYQKSLKLFNHAAIKDDQKLALSRARVLTNTGILLDDLNEHQGALEAHRSALTVLNSIIENGTHDVGSDVAHVLENIGSSYHRVADGLKALGAFKGAFDVLNEGDMQSRVDLDADRARVSLNISSTFANMGKSPEALQFAEYAQVLYESPTVGPQFSRDRERCRLYSNMSHLFSEMTSPHSWARDKSGRIAGMLELAPPEGIGPWSEMRSSFRSFHKRWLGYALLEGDVEPIPEILAALQGRDVAAGVLDRLAQEAADDAGTDAALAAYQAARAELRRLAESIRDDGVGAFGFDDDFGGGSRGAGSDGGAALPPGARNAREAKLFEEYRALHDKLPALREAAAEVPGFEILRAPHRQVTQAWLRESLGADEAILLAFVHDGVTRAAVLRGDGDGALVDLPVFADNAADMERFSRSLSGRGGLRDGGWSDTGKGSYGTTEAAAVDRMTETELAAFWDATAAAQRTHLWAPLTEALAGATRVIGITHGRLQLAALSAGAPADAEIVQYPGLSFYALSRGLYGDRNELVLPAAPCISIVRGDHADLQYSPLEEQASVALWRSTGADVRHPDYPREGRVGLLHVTSHGDLLDDGSPVILLGRDASGQMRTLGERDILRGPPIEAAFLNLCLGGRLSEDPLDGSPSGLVSALMRRGAKVVVAALPPVDDLWACVLGLMVTEAMATEGLPLDKALAIAKRRLGEGVPTGVIASLRDWYMARLDHVVREHAYSHRRNPEACARAALKAALGNDEDAAPLAELLAVVPDRDRPATATLLLREPAWTAFEARLAQGPGPAEYGALVHGMIAFGESARLS